MLVAEPHRPTLQEELTRLPKGWRRAAIAVVALILLAALARLVGGALAGEEGTRTVVREPIAFNLRYPDTMERVQGDALLHLRRPGKDEFIVEPLTLPAYRGDAASILPVQASREMDALERRFPALEPVEEGKVRINDVAGYSLVFRVSRSPRLYGRLVLLPEPVPGSRRGAKLLLMATPAGGVETARAVGGNGQLKTPYRSFRFGTEGP